MQSGEYFVQDVTYYICDQWNAKDVFNYCKKIVSTCMLSLRNFQTDRIVFWYTNESSSMTLRYISRTKDLNEWAKNDSPQYSIEERMIGKSLNFLIQAPFLSSEEIVKDLTSLGILTLYFDGHTNCSVVSFKEAISICIIHSVLAKYARIFPLEDVIPTSFTLGPSNASSWFITTTDNKKYTTKEIITGISLMEILSIIIDSRNLKRERVDSENINLWNFSMESIDSIMPVKGKSLFSNFENRGLPRIEGYGRFFLYMRTYRETREFLVSLYQPWRRNSNMSFNKLLVSKTKGRCITIQTILTKDKISELFPSAIVTEKRLLDVYSIVNAERKLITQPSTILEGFEYAAVFESKENAAMFLRYGYESKSRIYSIYPRVIDVKNPYIVYFDLSNSIDACSFNKKCAHAILSQLYGPVQVFQTNNSLDIGTNSLDIGTNLLDIDSSLLDVGTNSVDVDTNLPDIDTNLPDIDTNLPDINSSSLDINDGLLSSGIVLSEELVEVLSKNLSVDEFLMLGKTSKYICTLVDRHRSNMGYWRLKTIELLGEKIRTLELSTSLNWATIYQLFNTKLTSYIIKNFMYFDDVLRICLHTKFDYDAREILEECASAGYTIQMRDAYYCIDHVMLFEDKKKILESIEDERTFVVAWQMFDFTDKEKSDLVRCVSDDILYIINKNKLYSGMGEKVLRVPRRNITEIKLAEYEDGKLSVLKLFTETRSGALVSKKGFDFIRDFFPYVEEFLKSKFTYISASDLLKGGAISRRGENNVLLRWLALHCESGIEKYTSDLYVTEEEMLWIESFFNELTINPLFANKAVENSIVLLSKYREEDIAQVCSNATREMMDVVFNSDSLFFVNFK